MLSPKKFATLASALWLIQSACPLFAGVEFNRAFAPTDHWVSQYEQLAREELCLDGSWQFQADKNESLPGDASPQLGAWDKVLIKIPSPWNINAFCMENGAPGGDFRAYPSYPKEWETTRAAWMEKSLLVPKSWEGRRTILRFGAVAGNMVVFVNGQRVGEGFDIFFPQEFDVTKAIHYGTSNEILVKVVASKVFDKSGKFGRREYLSGSFWGTYISGIWQDVYLLAQPEVAATDIFVQPLVDHDELRVEAEISNHSPAPQTVSVSGVVREWMNQAGTSTLDTPEVKWNLAGTTSLQLPAQEISIAPGASQKIILSAKVSGNLKPWSPDSPNLYGLLLTSSIGGKPVDVKYQRFGWRQFTVDGNKFLLNGQPITLRGDSWHFMGVPQMTRRYAYGWYRLLKDAGANAVRLHASVYPPFYHDLADEMGIMILDESAIWASDGGPKADSDLFWENCRQHVAGLVRRDRNHPSVFGWSVCNEILPVLRNVWHTPQSMVDHCLDEIAVWKNICVTNDPTRTWISGDGEWDANDRLPIINIHYGGNNEMQRAEKSGKPWAVGETSMAYYGTPKQVSQFNGNRAYESDLGRMEGLAYECYSLLTGQQKYGGNYQSVFNLVWYSIQPLPLGKSDLTKPNSLEDGIFFGPFKEGVPGMQPERLGPYVSTLNPGYDPELPLYRPWPMFEAIRDVNLLNTNSIWSHRKNPSPVEADTINTNQANATVAFLPDNGAHLSQTMKKAGIVMSPYNIESNCDFLMLDGSLAPASETAMKDAIEKVASQGGTIWIWNLQPTVAPMLGKIIGSEILAEPRVASSFIVKQPDPLLHGLDNAALYLSEGDDWRQMTFGLGGDFVKHSRVILEASVADWRQWNYKGEPVKTAALFRSEVENAAPRAAIVIGDFKKGRVILCNVSPEIRSPKKLAIFQRLFRNEGIQPTQIVSEGGFTDVGNRLVRALACGSFGVTNLSDAYAAPLPPAREIKNGASFNSRKWRMLDSSEEGVFDFKNESIRGPQENAYVYLAVWIKSAKPLNDLLSEPNLPKLSFTYGSDDGCQVWLNGEQLGHHERTGPLEPDGFSINPLLLKLGWNQLLIKVVQGTGEWKFAGKFACTDTAFLSKLEFAAEKPAD